MDRLERIHTDNAPAAIGPYSQAIGVGDFVFCSGQVSLDPQSMELIQGDVEAQTRQVFANLRAVLEAAGASLSTVVKTTVFLSDMDLFGPMNGVYAEEFGDHRPARSTVAVRTLPKNVDVEIEAIAVRIG